MKKSHRILRDASLVIVFCVGFLGLIWLANFLQNSPAEQTSSEFSEYRIGADQASQGNDLKVSSENLRALIKNDPFDGRAQYELASMALSRVIEAQDLIAASKPTPLPGPINPADRTTHSGEDESWKQSGQLRPLKPRPAASSSVDADTEANEQVQVLIDEAIHEYTLAARHARYRLRSQLQLAVLFATKGDDDAALDNLDKFVTAGGVTRRGLDQIEQFGSGLDRTGPTRLHNNQQFLVIVDKERENRIGRGGYPRLERLPRRMASPRAFHYLAPSLTRHDTGIWNFLERLNDDLIPYRIKLVNLIREFFE